MHWYTNIYQFGSYWGKRRIKIGCIKNHFMCRTYIFTQISRQARILTVFFARWTTVRRGITRVSSAQIIEPTPLGELPWQSELPGQSASPHTPGTAGCGVTGRWWELPCRHRRSPGTAGILNPYTTPETAEWCRLSTATESAASPRAEP